MPSSPSLRASSSPRLVVLGAAFTVVSLLAPAGAGAQTSPGTTTTPAFASASFDGSDVRGFDFAAGASRSGKGRPRFFFSFDRSKGLASESHNFSFKRGASLKLARGLRRGSLGARLGGYGKVSLRFRATGRVRTLKPAKGCTGGSGKSAKGVFTGTVRIKAGAYFKNVRLRRATGTVSSTPKQTCKPPPAGNNPTTKNISLNSSSAEGSNVSLSVSKSPNGRVSQDVFVQSKKDGAAIFRTASIERAPAGSFTVAADASSATLKAAGPFLTGMLKYTATDFFQGGSNGTITGDYAAKFATGKVKVIAGAPAAGFLFKPGFVPPPPPNQPPEASFISLIEDLQVHFTNTSKDDGDVVSSSWNFGDGSTSTISSPSHTYAAAGTYQVSLTVTDDQGATASTTKTVTVTAPENF